MTIAASELRTIVLSEEGPAARITLNRPEKRNALSLELMREVVAALEMLLTGDLVSADTALEWGLVNRVVPEDRLDEAVAELVERIVRSSPLTVAIGKEAFYGQVELDEHRAYELTKSVMTMNSLAGDAQEGMCAFLEKRPPEWRGT